MSIATVDPVTLLKGKLSVNDFYMSKPFPDPTQNDIDEFNKFSSTLKSLYEVGIIFKVDDTTIGGADPRYLLKQKIEKMSPKVSDSPDM